MNSDLKSAFFASCRSGNLERVRQALHRGADVNSLDEVFTAIYRHLLSL